MRIELKGVALIEDYGNEKLMPIQEQNKMDECRVLQAYKGFCTLYPLFVPEKQRQESADGY